MGLIKMPTSIAKKMLRLEYPRDRLFRRYASFLRDLIPSFLYQPYEEEIDTLDYYYLSKLLQWKKYFTEQEIKEIYQVGGENLINEKMLERIEKRGKR